jgi:hypothetical protein
MLMPKKCGNCGNPVYEDASVFCNKCGARLPVTEFLTCKRCGTVHSDLKSQFCSKCGVPLNVPAPPSSRSPQGLGKICPGCGFVNGYENSFYCKKCGISIGKTEPDASTQKGRSEDAAIRTKAGPANFTRQKTSTVSKVGQEPPYIQGEKISHKDRSGSNRKIAAAAIVIMLIIIALGIVTIYVPGIMPANGVNSTGSGLAGSPAQNPAVVTPTSSAAGLTKPDKPAPDSSLTGISVAPVSTEKGNPPAPESLVYNNITPPWPTEVAYNSTAPWPMVVDYDAKNPWPMVVEYNATNPWPMVVEYNATNPWPT